MADPQTVRLQPRYLFLGRVIAWSCSRCEQLFSLSADEALGNGTDEPPEPIRAQFQGHDCGVVLFARLAQKHPGIEQALLADASGRNDS